MDLLKRLRSLKLNGISPDERMEIIEFVYGDDPTIQADVEIVKEKDEGVIHSKNEQDDLVHYKVIADEYGYSISGVRSAIDKPENGIAVHFIGRKRYISRAQWEHYMNTVAYGPKSKREPKERDTRNPNRLVENWHQGGSSKRVSNHEIRGWMTIPQCAKHTAIQEVTIRNLIAKGLLTTVELENKDGAADVYGVHADEVYSQVNRGPRRVPDVTVFERWDKVTVVAEVLGIEQTHLSKMAAAGEIASHRIGRYLYVHIGEIEKLMLS